MDTPQLAHTTGLFDFLDSVRSENGVVVLTLLAVRRGSLMFTLTLIVAIALLAPPASLLVMVVILAMQHGYPDDSFRPAPGRKWPRITPRTFMAVLRGRA